MRFVKAFVILYLNMVEVDTGLKYAEIKRILAVLRRNPKIRRILLFGSRAKGSYQKGSDIDIAVSRGGFEHRRAAAVKSWT